MKSRKMKVVRLMQLSLSHEQRFAVERARAELAPHFAGEIVKLYVPLELQSDRIARHERIMDALAQGRSALEIARDEGVTPRTVRRVRGQFTRRG